MSLGGGTFEGFQEPKRVDGGACNQYDPSHLHLALKMRSRDQDEDEASKRKQYRQRIKRHAEPPDLALLAMLWQERGCALQQELKQDTDDHEGGDDLLQPKDATEQSDAAEG